MTATSGADIVPVERRKTGRPALTSRADLLAAARVIGFRDLTIGRVTKLAGVKYSTLFRHFTSRAALTAALVDDVFRDAPIPKRDGWRSQLEASAKRIADVLREWPGMSDALASLAERPAWIEATHRTCVDAMVRDGFTDDETTEHDVDVVLALAALDPRQINAEQAGHDPAAVTAWAVGLVLNGIAAEVGER